MKASRRSCALERLESRLLLAGQGQLQRHYPKIVFAGEIEGEGPPAVGIAAPADLVAPETPSQGSSIEALNFDQNASTTGFYEIPPDPIVAAGPSHIVNIVNSTIEWYTKGGTRQNRQRLGKNGSTATGSFFASLSPVNGLFDPKVVYDTYNNRFVVAALEQQDTAAGDPTDSSRVLLAVSDDSDPNGTWYFGAINTRIRISGQYRWLDYPGLAVDSQAVYVTGNMFSFGNAGSFGGSRLFILPKTTWYAGGALTSATYNPSSSAGLTSQAFTLQPAQMYGTAPAGLGTFLVNSGWVSGSTDLLSVIRVSNPLSSPTFSNQFITLGDIHNTSAGFPSDIPQLGSAHDIDGGDNRVYSAVWRDNALWVSNTINPTSGVDAGTATAHWYKINTTNLASLSLADQGNISGEDIAPGTRTFYAAITVDSLGNMGIGFAASGPNIYPGAYYTGHETSDAAGTVQPSVALAAGQDFYYRAFGDTRNRWGDYSGICIDPSDNTTFWLFNEYALTRGTILSGLPTEDGRWGTRIGSFSFVPPAIGDITGVVFRDNNSDGSQTAGELGVDGVTVFLDTNNNTTLDAGESSTTTTGGGSYSFTGLAAGSYNVRQILPAGYIFILPSSGMASVSVTGGSTTNQNFADFPTAFAGGSGNDTWTIQTDPSLSTRVQVLESINGGAVTTYQILKSTFNAAGATFSFSGASGADTLNFDGPVGVTLSFSGGTGADVFNLNSGSYTFAGDVAASTAALTLNVNAGSAVFDATQHLAGLTIAAGASAIMNTSGNRYLQTASLSIVGSGKLDLNDNDLVVDYTGPTSFTQVRQWVSSGYSTTIDPSKSGIVSSTSQAGGGKTILAVFDTALKSTTDWPPGSGNTVDSTTVIGKYTYFGDVNLDGQVTGDDYTVVDSRIGATPPPGSAWPDGDANLDGIVTGDDYTTIDSTLGLGVGNPL